MGGLSGWTAAFAVASLAAAATLAGGLAVLNLRSRLDVFLAAASGAVVGVALFDLLPEAFTVALGGQGPRTVATAVGVGFALYLALDRAPALFGRASVGVFAGPASLVLHSLLDGFGVGTAFRASAGLGWMVGLAVLAHDMVDGANTVTLSLSTDSRSKRARAWLLADAAAPLAGVVLAALTPVPREGLATLLALFCGFFLYIGASVLIPLSNRNDASPKTFLISLAAMAMMGALTRLIAV